jgi:hypothetical protein
VAVGLQNQLACRNCTPEKCHDCPTSQEPLCIRVSGKEVEIAQCPNRWIGPDIRRLVRYASMAKAGILQTSGGWQDQSAWLIDGIEFVWAEQENQRRELLDKHG